MCQHIDDSCESAYIHIEQDWENTTDTLIWFESEEDFLYDPEYYLGKASRTLVLQEM